MATNCTCRHRWIQHAKGGPGGSCSVDDCPCTGFTAGAPSHIYTPADLAADMEVAQAAELWNRLVALWEACEQVDELHNGIGALVDEWQGFVAKKAEPA
jgi:hypothetical protein